MLDNRAWSQSVKPTQTVSRLIFSTCHQQGVFKVALMWHKARLTQLQTHWGETKWRSFTSVEGVWSTLSTQLPSNKSADSTWTSMSVTCIWRPIERSLDDWSLLVMNMWQYTIKLYSDEELQGQKTDYLVTLVGFVLLVRAGQPTNSSF